MFGNPSPRNDVTIIKKTDRDHSRRMLLSVDLIMSAYTDTKSSMKARRGLLALEFYCLSPQGRNMVHGLRAQSPKYDWDQGSQEKAQGSEEWDQGSQGF